MIDALGYFRFKFLVMRKLWSYVVTFDLRQWWFLLCLCFDGLDESCLFLINWWIGLIGCLACLDMLFGVSITAGYWLIVLWRLSCLAIWWVHPHKQTIPVPRVRWACGLRVVTVGIRAKQQQQYLQLGDHPTRNRLSETRGVRQG